MKHVVLLGDSVFDNGIYVEDGEPDVADQLRSRLSIEDEVTLLAVDGHLTSHVSTQLKDLPNSATHLVLSIGGNDALGYLNVLDRFDEPVRTVGEAVQSLKEIQDEFRQAYNSMLEEVLDRNLPTCLCTIYNGNFEDPDLQDNVDTILPVINDVIRDAAIRNDLPLIELGRVCDVSGDYANPIEPSAQGGNKIAATIQDIVEHHDFDRSRTEIFAGDRDTVPG